MRARSRIIAGLALGALALAGCAEEGPVIGADPTTSSQAPTTPPADTGTASAPHTETPTTTTTSDDPADETTATATAAPPEETRTATAAPEAGIQDFDFLNATMADSWEHREVTLVAGEAIVETDAGPTRYRLGADSIDMVDLDGDGDNDALVRVFAEAGNGWSDYTYAWLWDEERRAAEQVLPAVTDDARCGNITQDIVPTDGDLVVRYLDRSVNDEACAEPPAAEAERTVRIKDRYALQVAPHRTALGHCGEISAEPMPPGETGLPGEAVLAYPADDAPVVATFEEIEVLSLPEASLRTREDRPGWTKVLFTLPGQDQGALARQCGWTPSG